MDGVRTAVSAMTSHDLIREDLDSLLELTSWPDFPDPMANVETKVSTVNPLYKLLFETDSCCLY